MNIFVYWSQIVSDAKAGDSAAAELIVQTLFIWTRKELLRKGCYPQDEDVIGSFVLHLIRDDFKRLHIGNTCNPRSFLRSALRHFMIDCWRCQRRYKCRELIISEMGDEAVHMIEQLEAVEDPLRMLLVREQIADIQGAVRRLSMENQSIFIWWVEGYSYFDIAALSGLKENTVKQRIYSIRRQILKTINNIPQEK